MLEASANPSALTQHMFITGSRIVRYIYAVELRLVLVR
jgi:hypothetical protein